MRNYIRAELYRNIRRAYFINFTLITSIIAILGNLLIYIVAATKLVEFSFAFEIGRPLLMIPLFLVIIFVEMVFYEEFRNSTIKNAVSLGLDRKKLVVAKTLVEIILAFISASIILLVYFISARLMAGPDKLDLTIVNNFIYSLLGALPIWIAGIAIANFLGLTIESEFMKGLSYIGLISLLPNIIKIIGNIYGSNTLINIGLKTSLNKTITEIVNSSYPQEIMLEGLIKGAIFFIVFTTLTILVFDKKDL